MTELLSITALCISIGYIAYQAGKKYGYRIGYEQGWGNSYYQANSTKQKEWQFKESRLN